jgi:hypothetical protein
MKSGTAETAGVLSDRPSPTVAAHGEGAPDAGAHDVTAESLPRWLQPGRGTGGHGGLSGLLRARPGHRSHDMLARHEITGL